MERPDWIDDPRFGKVVDRVKHADYLERMMEEVLSKEDASHWVRKMEKAGVPGRPINSYDKALGDPHFLARDMILELEHPKAGRIKSLGIAAKMSETPDRIRFPHLPLINIPKRSCETSFA